MQRWIYLLCLPCLGACETDDVVAADDKPATQSLSAEEQLAQDLADLCAAACDHVVACVEPNCVCDLGDVCNCPSAPDPQTCPSDCVQATQEDYLGKGDACAQVALQMLNCIAGSECSALANGTEVCQTGSAPGCEQNKTDDSLSATGPLPGVTCTTGTGTAFSDGSTVPITCDETAGDCSDGHIYRISCAAPDGGSPTCTCIRDGVAENTFVTTSTSCPSIEERDVGCGWNLM